MTSMEQTAHSGARGYQTAAQPLMTDAPVPAILVAEHILHLRQRAGVETNFADLLGLTYVAHALMLTFHGEPLFVDKIEAWPPGPSIPAVYGSFQHHRMNPIRRPGTPGHAVLGPKAREAIRVVEKTFRHTDWRLLTGFITGRGTPWYNTFFGLGEGAVIANEAIRCHYDAWLQQAWAEQASDSPS